MNQELGRSEWGVILRLEGLNALSFAGFHRRPP